MHAGLVVRIGSCNRTDATPPFEITSGYLMGGGCFAGGAGCGVSVQLSHFSAVSIRPPGAPIEGNVSVNILGTDLASIRFCHFFVPGLPPGFGLSRVERHDASGFRCAMPALLNISLFDGYAQGAVSQPVSLRLSEDGQYFVDTSIPLVYFRQPVLTHASPLRGPITGATLVISGHGLNAVLGDASAARCLLDGLPTAVSSISASGDALACDVPPMPAHWSISDTHAFSIALDGLTFVDASSLGRFAYYEPLTTGSLHPVQAASEDSAVVSIFADRLEATSRAIAVSLALGGMGEAAARVDEGMRCQFGVAGTSAAQMITVPSTDPLRPELSHVELRCAAPPCMRVECIGTVEVTVSLNGIDYTGFTPPLLFRYTNEFVLHVWGCDNNATHSTAQHSEACGEAVVQRATVLSSEQRGLVERVEALQTELFDEKRPLSTSMAAALAMRRANRSSLSWELAQAARDAELAAASELDVRQRYVQATLRLEEWQQTATVARVPLALRSHVAIDALDKRVYWLASGALMRAHFGPHAQLGPPSKLISLERTAWGLLLDRPSARLYWTAQAEGGGYELIRAYLDGGYMERVLGHTPAETRALAASISADGQLSTTYVSISQPGNASLLLVVEAKDQAADAAPVRVEVLTLLRDVAPTSLAVHGENFYYSVAAARTIRRCALGGTDCVTIYSAIADRNAPLSSRLGGLALDQSGTHGFLWTDSLSRRLYHRTTAATGSAANDLSPAHVSILWRPAHSPTSAVLSVDAVASSSPAASPELLAITPLAGPVRGNASITIHGAGLGQVSQIRYVRFGEWLDSGSSGLALTHLPRCHVDCPQQVSDVTLLGESWRRLSNDSSAVHASGEGGTLQPICDNRSPQPMASDLTLSASRWYRFNGEAGHRMLSSAPGERRCGGEAAGWMRDSHPNAGDAPQPSTLCIAYGWSQCMWPLEVSACACSYDGGRSTIYSYRLPRPPGDPTCVSYCGDDDEASPVELVGGRRLQGYAVYGRDTGAAGGDDPGAWRDRQSSSPPPPSLQPAVDPPPPSPPPLRTLQPDTSAEVAPTTVSVAGGSTPVEAAGDGAHLDLVTETRLHGRTPSMAHAQRVALEASVDGNRWLSGTSTKHGAQSYVAITYSFFEEPTLSRIWPSAGPVSGGTNVTVSGSGFDVLPGLDGVRCLFEHALSDGHVTASAVAVDAYFKNDTHILCTTPRRARSTVHSAGRASVAITLNGQDVHRALTPFHPAASFVFYSAALHSLQPTCGTTRGGTYLTVHGAGLDSLGGIALDAAGVPYEPRYRMSVVSFTGGGSQGGVAGAAGDGGTDGSADGSAGVVWGPTRPFHSLGSSSAVLRPPPAEMDGRTFIQVALNGVDFEGELPYDYLREPSVTSITPSGGPTSGGTLVAVEGSGFRSIEQEDLYLEQWAASALSRSEYGSSAGAATQAVGPPDATGCADERLDANSWMPALGTNLPDWLHVSFRRAVRPWRWRVYLSAHPEAVRAVEAVSLTGERLPVPINVSHQELHGACACAGAASVGCSAIVEGWLDPSSHALVGGLRIHTLADGWEAIDAVQLAGYAETQRCKLGSQFAPLVEQRASVVSCVTPALTVTKLVVQGTSMSGATKGLRGFYYPLLLTPPVESHHEHSFAEHPGVTFYMIDAEARHARADIESAAASTLIRYTGAAVAVSSSADAAGRAAHPTLATNATDDCEWARDGLCDSPPFCPLRTDCTDCAECAIGVYALPIEVSLNGRDGTPLDLALSPSKGIEPVSSRAVAAADAEGPASVTFTYYPLPTLSHIYPHAVLAGGGSLLTIHGHGLGAFGDLNSTKCRIGARTGTALSKSPSQVICMAPASSLALPAADGAPGGVGGDEASNAKEPSTGAGGVVEVWLTLNDQDYQLAGARVMDSHGTDLQSHPPLSLSLSHANEHVHTSTCTCTRAHARAREHMHMHASTSIAAARARRHVASADRPPNVPTSAGEVLYFHFTVGSVRPSGGPSGGGSLLTIRGHGFTFDEAHPVREGWSREREHRAARCRFRYLPPLDDGPRAAGTGAASYLAGGYDGLAAMWPRSWYNDTAVLSRSPHELRCVTPPAPAGFVGLTDVLVTLNGLDYLPALELAHGRSYAPTSSDAPVPHFTFYRLRLHGLSPRGGPAQGGTEVVITGSGFGAFGTLEQVLCRFGRAGRSEATPATEGGRLPSESGLVVRATARDNTTVVCTSPDICDPLDTTSTACAAGDRSVPPVQRTALQVGGEVVNLVMATTSTPAWTAREVFISINGQDFSGVAGGGHYGRSTAGDGGGHASGEGGGDWAGEGVGDGGARSDDARSAASPLSFLFYPLPTLEQVVPSGGAAGSPAGTSIVVRGSGFEALRSGLAVGSEAMSVDGSDAGTMPSTPVEPGGSVYDADPSDLRLWSAHFRDMVDETFDPAARAPGRAWCKFGSSSTGLAVAAVSHNDSAVTCPVPPSLGAGAHLVLISLNGLDWFGGEGGHDGGEFSGGSRRAEVRGAPLTYQVFEQPTLVSVHPTAALTSGGISVTLSGARFDVYGEVWHARCRFGVDVVPAAYKSATSIVCLIPPTSQPRERPTSLYPIRGVERVAASVDGGRSWTGHDPLAPVEVVRYDARALYLSPAMGPATGGYPVRIHADGLQVELPPLAAPSAAAYGHEADMTLAREQEGLAMCAFGSDLRPAARRSAGWVECTVPSAFEQLSGRSPMEHQQQEGLDTAVQVSLRGRDFLPTGPSSVPLAFSYFPEPALRELTPVGGPSQGGTEVTFMGDFPRNTQLSSTHCRFGERRVSAHAASSTEVRCLSPPHTPSSGAELSSVVASLTFNDGAHFSDASPALKFLFYVLALSACSPLGGPTAGGTLLTVRGSGFGLLGQPNAVRGRFTWADGQIVDLGTAVAVSTGSVQFRTAAVHPHEVGSSTSERLFSAGLAVGVTLHVAINTAADYQGDFIGGATSSISFHLFPPPVITSLSPAVGPVHGGTLLTVSGAGFDAFGQVPANPVIKVTSATVPGMPYAGYVVDGVLNGDLMLLRGVMYRFVVDARGHPLILSTVRGSRRRTGELTAVDGVQNSGIEHGTLTFTPSARTPATLFYQDLAAGQLGAPPVEGRRQAVRLLPATAGCSVRVGGARFSPLARTNASLELRMPRTPSSGLAMVDVSLNGAQFEATTPFFYYTPPRVSTIYPTSGPSDGGTHLTITGANLALPHAALEAVAELPTPAVLLDGTLHVLSAISAGRDAFNMTLPPLPPGSHELWFTLNGRVQDASRSGASIFVWAPIVVGVTFAMDYGSEGSGGATGGSGGVDSSSSSSSSASASSPSSSSSASSSGIDPAGGPIAGGTIVTIGPVATLPAGLAACCTFGNPETASCDAAAIIQVSETTDILSCSAPMMTSAGSVPLGISLNGGVDVASAGAYVYTNIAIAYAVPAGVPADGGTLLTIYGSGFLAQGVPTDVARCRFTYEEPQLVNGVLSSQAEVPLRALAETSFQCEELPTCGCIDPDVGCSVGLSLVRNGIDASAPLPIDCYAPQAVGALKPSAGPVGGGTPFVVSGGPYAAAGASVAAFCRLGSSTVLAGTATSEGVLCAPTPASATLGDGIYGGAATVPVRISLNGQDYSPTRDEDAPHFSFYETPYIQRIRPTAGPVRGGTSITLSGLRLSAGGWASTLTMALRLGSPSSYQPLNASTLDEDGTSLITSPTAPPLADCTRLCCVLRPDGLAHEGCAASDAAAAPAAPAGACSSCFVSLGIAPNSLNFDWPYPPVRYAFYDSSNLTITSVFPHSGPEQGGTEVTIYGSALHPAGAAAEDARCRFGSDISESLPVSWADPGGTMVVCGPTPPFAQSAAEGEAEEGAARGNSSGLRLLLVSVAPNGVDFESGAQNVTFYVYPEPSPSTMLPHSGPAAGGTSILVAGSGLEPGPHTSVALARCRYGRREPGAVVNVSSIDTEGIRCDANPSTSLYTIGVDKGLQIALNGQQFSPAGLGLPFRYYVQPELSRIWPTGGPVTGGTPVTLFGRGFDRIDIAGVGAVGASGGGVPLCLFGGVCFDEHDVHRGLRCAEAPAVTHPSHALAALATMRSFTTGVCHTPPVEPPQHASARSRTSVRVALALNAQNFVHVRTPLFVYYAGVSATALHPARGPPLGGIEIRVSGTQLNVFGETRDARCRFSHWSPLVAGASLGWSSAASQVVYGKPTHKDEDHMVCRTPPFPAGTVEVAISLNERDYHEASPPLTHRYECEQHDPRDAIACVSDHSCGHCRDELPEAPLDYTKYGITQDRFGCFTCHAEGCGAGPAEGSCRRWSFETPLLLPAADGAESRALELANVSVPSEGETNASAHGWLLPDQMRYFRVRPPHGSVRLVVTVRYTQGHLLLLARRSVAPGAEVGAFDLESSRGSDPLTLIIPQEELRCEAATHAERGGGHGGEATSDSAPVCEDWVIGVLGRGWQQADAERGPPRSLSDFALSVRIEPHAADFSCAECGHGCSPSCGWQGGHSTQFLLDERGSAVARLTNDTHQRGTLWMATPQPYSRGFEVSFAVRISERSVCTQPIEMYGANTTTGEGEFDGRPFIPFEELHEARAATTHYLIDDPTLPFEPLPPPQGVPAQLAKVLGKEPSPTARYGVLGKLASGIHAPFLPRRNLGCPEGVERVGGEGFAFVLQGEGLNAAGCAGTGVGHAAAAGCTDGGIASSLAVQFDTHHNARTVREEHCVDADAESGGCKPGALKVVESLQYDRMHAVSIFAGGINVEGSALITTLLGRYPPTRLDDGLEHEVRLTYLPAVDGEPEGRLDLYFDGSRHTALSLPLSLPMAHNGALLPVGGAGGAANNTQTSAGASAGDAVAAPAVAYVGFTASTGEASERHDILRASYCHMSGCAAV